MRAGGQSNGGGQRAFSGPGGLWPLLAAVPLDLGGFYLALSALHVVPAGWPAADLSTATLVTAATGLFAAARAIALIALRHLLHWRAASNAWSRAAVRDPQSR